MSSEIDCYCLNFTTEPHTKNERRLEMERKFATLNITSIFYSGVPNDDKRLLVADPSLHHTWSICYGHLDMINHFYLNSKKEYAIFCEDDILIHKEFTNRLSLILNVLNQSQLDLLLIGYLCSNPIDTYSNFPEITHDGKLPHKFLEYPDSTWGTQMYILSKSQAKRIIDKYYDTYAERSLKDTTIIPFSADWTITKEGKRALLYPLLVIENGLSIYVDEGQEWSHKKCFDFSYKPDTYI
jgi:hypothetical protein